MDIKWVLTTTEGKSKKYNPGSKEYQKLRGLKAYSAGIVVPGHGIKFDKKEAPPEAPPTKVSTSKIKTIWMNFFRLGGGLGDGVANGLFLAAAVLFSSIFLLPILLVIKFTFFVSCILTVRLYRQNERSKLKNEFKKVLSKNPKELREYIQNFVDIYYDNLEIYNVTESPPPLGDVNSISNGKFKKLLCYETTFGEPNRGFDVKRYTNIINHLIFLSHPMSDTIINDNLRLYSYIYLLNKYGYYKFISAFAKKYGYNLNDDDLSLLQQALRGLCHDIDLPTLRRIVQVIGQTIEIEQPA